MNHTYRPVFNTALNAWVAVPETARARGKAKTLKAASAVVLSALTFHAHALPDGATVSAGSGTVATTGSTTTVNQSSPNLAINWQSFNVGASETFNFVQPGASAIALNRVLGANGSQILGRLNANGQVWILNPNGVLFGKTAQVNVGGLVASTLGMSDTDFMAGKRTFSGSGGEVKNQGNINAAYVALLGEQVKNEGVIVANLGTVGLAAGNRVTLDFAGDKLLGVQIDEGALHALVDNKNLIQADGGLVVMTAKARDALLETAVNNSGVVRARSLENRQGKILLLGDMDSGTTNVGGTLDASAPHSGDGGFIETSAAHVKVADGTHITTQAANGESGTWLIDPVDFTIAAGSGALTTSGIGADTLSANLGSGNVSIATDPGTGGNGDIFVNSAVSWSANKLTLTAHRNIEINANLNGSGSASLALEYGQSGGGGDYFLGNGAKVSLPAGLNFTTKNGGAAATDWTVITDLGVQGDATVAPGVMTLQGMNTGLAGNYVLGADIDASGTSTWNANQGFTPVGTNFDEFTGKFDGLGHTISGLAINLSGGDWRNYGLFGDTNNAVLQNVGLLNVNIQGGSNGGTGALAGKIDGTTAIRNSYVDGGSVSTATNVVGGLVGLVSSGSISHSYAAVSVSAQVTGGAGFAGAGGLVGVNNGAISYNYATGSVSAPISSPGSKWIGGLAGTQNAGSISYSYATGAVSGNSFLGGLVGNKPGGSVTNSYWDTQTTGQATSAGSIAADGKTTAEMKQLATFAGWDIDDAGSTGKVWRIYEGNTAPLLRNFLTPLTVTANNASKTYDGTAYSGGAGVTRSDPTAALLGSASYGGNSQGATNTGSYTIVPGGFYSNQQGYDIAYANGTLTIAAAAPGPTPEPTPAPTAAPIPAPEPTPMSTPTVPGPPPDAYAGAVVSALRDWNADPALLASADGAPNEAAPTLPGLPRFFIQDCGQMLPPHITDSCKKP